MVFQNFDAYFYSDNPAVGFESVLITQSKFQYVDGALIGVLTNYS